MADDERSESSDAVFDPGDSSQVRKAVQNGYVPPAPKVPALKAPALKVPAPPPVAGSIARGKAPAKKPTEAASAASAVTKASEAKSTEHATADGVADEDSEDESVSKPGHVVPALGAADPEASSDPSTASGVRATDDARPRPPSPRASERSPRRHRRMRTPTTSSSPRPSVNGEASRSSCPRASTIPARTACGSRCRSRSRASGATTCSVASRPVAWRRSTWPKSPSRAAASASSC